LLQELSAPAQEPWPLQELMPAHFTTEAVVLSLLPLVSPARAAAARNIEATAEAIIAFFTFIVAPWEGSCGELRFACGFGFSRLGEKRDLDGAFLGHHRRELLHAGEPALGVLGADLVLVAVEVIDLGADADAPVGDL